MKTKLVIFGITGDLAKRKLLPALEQIVERKVFDDLEIVGVSRRNVSASDVVGHKLQSVTSVYCMDLANKDDYVGLADYLGSSENQQLVFYLSVPPLATAQITEFLGLAKINGTNTKIPVSYTHLRAHETVLDIVCRLLLEKKKNHIKKHKKKKPTSYNN